ncbi:hypothetical protein V9T40_014302 [Parthenolecanium corni]|uniref:Uncharacterized protein n=1 Tax=Parthenolecanium corni TaxID=536013 RepID=A0AAN9XXD7_9HEMI
MRVEKLDIFSKEELAVEKKIAVAALPEQQEKDEAVERFNQSQLLIERLEDELKNLKELSPTSEKHFFNMKEYVQIIDTMRDKMKTVQERLNDELKSNNKKDSEIKILNDKLADLSRRFKEDEKELLSLKQALKQEQERKLHLESELIASEKKLYFLQNKYQYVNDLEEERDKLLHENAVLSKESNELEFALEVCHQKIDCYERELQKMNEDLKLLIGEKVSITKRHGDFKGIDEVTELKDVILNLSSKCKKVNEDTENLFNEKDKLGKESSQIKIRVGLCSPGSERQEQDIKTKSVELRR